MRLISSKSLQIILLLIYLLLPIVSLPFHLFDANIILKNKLSSTLLIIMVLILYKRQRSLNQLIVVLYLYYFIFLVLATSGIFS